MAIEEINREITRASVRAEKVGPSGWQPCPLRKTNKRFLTTTIRSAVNHNKNQTNKTIQKAEQKSDELEFQNIERKFGNRKHAYRKPYDKNK